MLGDQRQGIALLLQGRPIVVSGATAPDGYQPDIDPGLVYDDQIPGLAPSPRWCRYFAGGSNRPYFVRVDETGEPHFVEQVDFDGSHEAYGPGYGLSFDNARDAFWAADLAIGGHNEGSDT